MPTKYAVRTSILSKSWRYRWTLVWNLDFEDVEYSSIQKEPVSDSFSKFVDRVLECCKSPQVKSFRLHVRSSVPKSSVLKWTDKAVTLNPCEIDIRAYKFELPLSLLSCKTLTKLILYRDISFAFQEGPCLVNLPCLKSLGICAYRGPFVSVLTLISGCPILENLSFQVWRRDEDEDYVFNHPTLKRLALTVLACASVNTVVLHTPNLEYLFVGGQLCSSFVMENVSSLVEAYVVVLLARMDHLWVELLKGISGVRSLSAGTLPSSYRRDKIISPLPFFPNLKRLNLKNCWHSGHALQFLESFPELEHLHVELSLESPWIEQKPVPACMLTSLTTINISKFTGKEHDVLFVGYILGKSKVLKTVTITCDDLCMHGFWAAQVLNFPRASSQCEVRFL